MVRISGINSRFVRSSVSRKKLLLNPCIALAFFVLFLWGLGSYLSQSKDSDPPRTSTNSNKDKINPTASVNRGAQKGTRSLNGKERTVAFAVSITGCGPDPITEGAAVLKHSIHRASVHGTKGGTFDYEILAIYHPSAEACTLPLQELGYKLMKREIFVKLEDIKGDYLRKQIRKDGCCGEKELLKLEAYTLTDFPIVVHVDLDALVLKPLDEIFNWMLHPPSTVPKSESIMWPNLPWPSEINAVYTIDYNKVFPNVTFKPVQGGLLFIRPSMKVYKEFRNIVLEGDFREETGWGGKVGPFWGSMTFQGLISYYYNYLHPGQSVELSRCIYNQMCDNPRTGRTVNNIVSGVCKVGTEECEDCRSRPLEDVISAHLCLCDKPWYCLNHAEDRIQERLCRKLTAEWYKARSELEMSWGRTGRGSANFKNEVFYGFCKYHGEKGYMPIEKPYGHQKNMKSLDV